MSRKSSSHSPRSWLDSLAGLFGTSTRKASSRSRDRRRSLRLEPLENRTLLSVNVLGSISGVAYYNPSGTGLTSSATRLSNVTVTLYKDGGNGVFDNGAGDDTVIGATQTNSSGSYSFTGLSAGTYFVQQSPAPGYVLSTADSVATVTITTADLQGTTGLVIDSFSATMESATAAYPSGATGSSYATATEAIGGARDMYVQRTSTHGSVALAPIRPPRAPWTFPPVPDPSAPGKSCGKALRRAPMRPSPALRNPTGLNHLDLTSSGAATGIQLTLGADRTGTAVLTIYTDANDWSTATVTIPDTGDGTATQDVFVPFSSFSAGAGAGANFTNVGAIQLVLSGPAAIDAQVADIETLGPAVQVHNFANTVEADLAIVKTGVRTPSMPAAR